MSQAPSPRDIAQRGTSLFLRRMSEVIAGQLAEEMGVSDSTVSEIKNKEAERVIRLLGHLGLKIVDAAAEVVDPDAFGVMRRTFKRAVETHPHLVFRAEGDE